MISIGIRKAKFSFTKHNKFPRAAPAADRVEDVEDDGFVTIFPSIGSPTTKGN